ncbi:MAG: VWA domain-containing protein [Pyrinomonadaceae bacterium]|nr:VWA domain-containing protein [Pyrinomonadaceae bacterium]
MRRNRFAVHLLLLTLLAAVTAFPGKVATLQQTNADTYNEQGLALMASEKFKEAIVAFQQAIKIKPDYPDPHYHLGNAYVELGETKKAVEAYKRAIRYKADFALAYDKLGTAYHQQQDYKKATEAYNESIRLDPKVPLTHYNLGVVYAERDKVQAAVAEYKILQTLDPNVAQDLFNLIYKPTVSVVTDGSVRLNVMAIDSFGAPIAGLKSENFHVDEGGTRQTVSLALTGNSPTFIGVAIDASGSLRSIFSLVVTVSNQIIERMQPDDQATLIRFVSADKIETVQDFTSSKRRLSDGIDSLYIEGGLSAVLDAVYLSAQHLAGHKFPNRNVRRVLLLLTDGDDRASYYNLQQVLTLLRSIDLQIFAVSFSSTDSDGRKLNENPPKQSADLLRTLALETGGAAFFPKSAAEMGATIKLIFDLVRAEYTIEYKPTQPLEAGTYRPVSVTLAPTPQHERSVIVSRPGYLPTAK